MLSSCHCTELRTRIPIAYRGVSVKSLVNFDRRTHLLNHSRNHKLALDSSWWQVKLFDASNVPQRKLQALL